MRIVNSPDEFEDKGVLISSSEKDSPELRNIGLHLLPEWLRLFAEKNADYGSGFSNELGIRGQYSDIHRKVGKLRRAMWEGEELEFEGTEEIILDLIGNLFLTLNMLGLKAEADRVYVYNEDDAAVDSFFRMVGGDPENALKMSGVLQHPFKDLVRDRAHKMLTDEQSEHAASIGDAEERRLGRKHFGRDVPISEIVGGPELAQDGARKARRKAREADGSPGEATLAAMRQAGAYGFDGDEFAQGDFEQNSVVVGYNFEQHEGGAKVGPPRIITEQVDGRTRYYHEAYPGSDREPLALVPKALIERAQKDHHVMNKEQEAGLRTLADWADNS
jgi:hypothetical protein